MAQLTDTLVSGDERVTGMIYGTQAGNYATCSEAGATKTATIPGFVLTTGVHVRIKFSAANTSTSPTLNVSGTGAKAIRVQGSTLPSADVLGQNGIYELVYDGTYWMLIGGSASYVNSDTKVKATAKSDATAYPILASATANPNGASTEAVYSTNIKLTPSTNTISANITGNAATATTIKTYKYTCTGNSNLCRVLAWLNPIAETLPANTSYTILLRLFSNETTYTDAGVIKVTVKTGSSDNTLSSVAARWIYRSGSMDDTKVRVYGAWSSTGCSAGIILDGPRIQYTGSYSVLNKDDKWMIIDYTNPNDPYAGVCTASSAPALYPLFNFGATTVSHLTQYGSDEPQNDSVLIDDIPGSGSSSGDTSGYVLPANVICQSGYTTPRYVKLSQFIDMKTVRFDIRVCDGGNIYLINNTGSQVTLYLPSNGGNITYTLNNNGQFILNYGNGSQTHAIGTSAWITRRASIFYVMFSY